MQTEKEIVQETLGNLDAVLATPGLCAVARSTLESLAKECRDVLNQLGDNATMAGVR